MKTICFCCLFVFLNHCFAEGQGNNTNDSLSGEDEIELLDSDDDLILDGESDLEPVSSSDSVVDDPLSIGGDIRFEYRYFENEGLGLGQDYRHNLSVAVEPQLEYTWDQGAQSFRLPPFFRYDGNDEERTHFDIREALWTFSEDDWILRAGIGKVFWGVTETRHTDDIINQTDLIENSDTESKLGQPLVNLSYSHGEFGTLDLFLLPGSRVRTFPGRNGRVVRPFVHVDADAPIFLGGASRHHIDYAVRWSHTFGNWDIGVAHFRGTTREPRIVAVFDNQGVPTKLRPVYEIINQTSLDIQGVTGNWLWKLETYTRSGQNKRFAQLTSGFEYTFGGIFETGTDWGLLFEYLYDGGPSNERFTPLDDDVFFGTRLALNDVQGTELLAGIFIDLDNKTKLYNIEASRRIGDDWKVYLEIRGTIDSNPTDVGHLFRNEEYAMLEIRRFF